MRWPPKETLHRDGDKYLERWHLLNTRFFKLYLHRFWRSDDDVYHDHPWSYVSLVLWGGYDEVALHGPKPIQIEAATWYGPGSILRRSATWRHRIVIRPELRGRVWTLVITGPKVREWGFYCPKGWIPWTVHVARRRAGQDGCP